VQLLATCVAATAAGVWSGFAAAAALMAGGLAVALPQWAVNNVVLAWPLSPFQLIKLEVLRVAGSCLALVLVAALASEFVWPAAVAGLIIALKSPWFVLLRED
jgi:hypothetical protein